MGSIAQSQALGQLMGPPRGLDFTICTPMKTGIGVAVKACRGIVASVYVHELCAKAKVS
jgi:hypothetical protein